MSSSLSRGVLHGTDRQGALRYVLAASWLLLALAAAQTAEPEQQPLFVGGQDGYHTYRIPALIVSKQGTLLAFCEGRKKDSRDSGDIDLLLRRSLDGGKTWQPTQVVWNDGPHTCGNPCPVVERDSGTIWLLLTHNLGSDTQAQIVDGKSKGTRTVWMTRSSNDGASWSKPVEITKDVKKPDWTWYATGPGVGIQLKNGRLVVPCDHQVAGSKAQHSHIIYSDDNGKTWQLGGSVGPSCNECQVVELADGALLLNMRSYRGTNRRLISLSKDGGRTWSKPVEDEALIEPVCQASLVRHPSAKGGLLFSNPASKKREKMTVRLSQDEGKSWPGSRVLHAGPAAYSCLTVLEGGGIGCLYERGDKHAYETITFACFPLNWLTETIQAPGKPGATSKQRRLVFSVKTWEGEYFSRDIPGDVATTPVVGTIHCVNADGTGLKKVIALGKNTDYATFSPDGRWVYFQSNATGRSQVYRCRPDGSSVVNLTEGDRLGKQWKDAYGYFLSSDGTKLLYTVHDGSSGRVALANADGTQPRLIAPELGYIYMASLSPTNDKIVFSGPARQYRLLMATLPDGKPEVLTPDHPDGKTIVFLRRDGDVYRVDADGKNLRRLSTDGPHISPDGHRIAYIAIKDGIPNVCVMSLDGREQRQLTFRKAPCGRVRWSPDGKQVAFISFEGKYPQLFVVAAEGGEPRQLTRLEGAINFLNWQP